MKKILNVVAVATLIVCAFNANAQENSKPINHVVNKSNLTTIDNKTLDLIIERLEKTGKLDVALNRVIDKRIKDQKEAQARQSLDQERKNQEYAKLIPGISDQDHYLGNKNARYSIIVYEDMECPFCKVYAEVPQNILSKMNDVNIISRANPLEMHMPAAAKEAVLAECVANELGNDGYFKFSRTIFQTTLTNGQGLPPLPEDYQFKGNDIEKKTFKELKPAEKSLFAVAKDSGVQDISKTLSCYTNPNTANKLQDLVQFSATHGITGTPTNIFKDNKTGRSAMVPGIMKEEELIDRMNAFINHQ